MTLHIYIYIYTHTHGSGRSWLLEKTEVVKIHHILCPVYFSESSGNQYTRIVQLVMHPSSCLLFFLCFCRVLCFRLQSCLWTAYSMQVAQHFQICISYAIPHTTPAKEDGPRKADIHICTVLHYVCTLRPDAENLDFVFFRLNGLVRLCLIRTYRTGLLMLGTLGIQFCMYELNTISCRHGPLRKRSVVDT